MRGLGFRFLVGLLALAVVLGGCMNSAANNTSVEEIVSKVSDDQVTKMAENALLAYNEADYAGYSRDWSDTMKSVITEDAFKEFQKQSMQSTGKFLSIEKMEKKAGQLEGVVRFEFLVNYELGQSLLMLAFQEDGDKIEGVTQNPVQ